MEYTRFIQRQLNHIERLGNRLPHPTLLFVYLCALIVVMSAVGSVFQVAAIHPLTGDIVAARSILSGEGFRYVLSSAVNNFISFAPVGTVLVAVMGMGVAEHSGLLKTLLSQTILRASPRVMTFLVVLAGVLSSLAADTGYVVLIPLAGLVFVAAKRNPLVGVAAAFAGVSGGYSANLLIGPLDALLAGISTEAAHLVAPGYEVSATGNYYFILASTFLIACIGTLVTEKLVEPALGGSTAIANETKIAVEQLPAAERKGLIATGICTLLLVLGLLVAIIPDGAMLRHPETGSLLKSPFISGIVIIISVYAALAGYIFGRVSGQFSGARDAIIGMETSMKTMASYLVLMFFAAQFVNWFGWSELGLITAIHGADFLKALDPNAAGLLVSFVLLAAMVNLLVGSASAKWALLAPIFVPMLLLVGISPEATQVAYRIGDSSTNIITPLMPYFGVVVAFMQKYDPKAGIGTLMSSMLPYAVVFLVCWSIMLAVWIMLGLPLGPGASVFLEAETLAH